MEYLPAKTSNSYQEQFNRQYERLQVLRSELAAHRFVRMGDVDLSEYYALFRKNEKLSQRISALEYKLIHIK